MSSCANHNLSVREYFLSLDCLTEDEGIAFFRNVGNLSSNGTVPHRAGPRHFVFRKD